MNSVMKNLSKVADQFEARPYTYSFANGDVPDDPNDSACVLAYLGYFAGRRLYEHCDEVAPALLGMRAGVFYTRMDRVCREVTGPGTCDCESCRESNPAWRDQPEACVKTIRRYVEKYAEAA